MRNTFFVFFSLIILFFSEGISKMDQNYGHFKKKENQTYNSNSTNQTSSIKIIFMLPLFLSSVKDEKIDNENKQLSENALYFYLGAKSAIDFLLLKNKKINVQVFDTRNERKRIINFIHSYDLSHNHAVIGPFFRSSLEEVAKNNKKTPIISPLSASDSLNAYPNVIQSEAKDIYLSEPILEEIKLIYQNNKIKTLYLLGEDPSKKMTTFIKKKLSQWNVHFQIFYLKNNFFNIKTSHNLPFFAIFLGGDFFIGKEFIDFVKNNKKIIPFGIGYHNVYYKNISLLREYKFLFTTKYHFNKNDEKKRKMFHFLKKKFGNYFNKYQLLGFDLTYDIIEKLFENKNLFKTIDQKSFSGLISKYKYQKISDKGGYINKGLWIIHL
ncbi:hypothetical protein BLBBGE_595 [Blattabacterium sp. (Blattella germanica) str. Bge]|uniref:hypothetical protein n=1 Tax=Blattabacterium sp. (Blattella germanica) TaxID=624186 RepID=UPI0001BB6289|nr:hypothetical protein [Blattabacterium sp. (Blattella germanica)]ACY40595.1 hypothetical protein BLBBGE_595 [Blattabacterium sp. (Blattella germanica) str. Bge]